MLKIIYLLLLVTFFSNFGHTIIKTWKFTNDILNPLNWEGEKPLKNCNGVIFPENLGSVVSISQLRTQEILLPKSGELEIRKNGFIEFSASSTCLKIKELKHRAWLNPINWNYGDNMAVPDVEKVPCVHDDVIFPQDSTVAVKYPTMQVYVNSIQYGGVNMTNDEWQIFLQSDYGMEQFIAVEFATGITIESSECKSKSGCNCHYTDDVLAWVCDNVKKEEGRCFEPIKPIGHCNTICGGVIQLEASHNFVLDDFKKSIPKNDKIDSYASKITKHIKPYVQLVFVEKEGYTERSAKIASEFHNTISKDLNGYNVMRANLQVSGMAIPEGSQAKMVFSIIMGTFVGVSLMFAFIYATYMGPLENWSFTSRIPFSEISFGNMRPFLFAKFDNKEEGRISMAASMVNLEKSFDNPMYRSHRPSTTSSGADVVVLTEAGPSTSAYENPSYQELNLEEVEILDLKEEAEKN